MTFAISILLKPVVFVLFFAPVRVLINKIDPLIKDGIIKRALFLRW